MQSATDITNDAGQFNALITFFLRAQLIHCSKLTNDSMYDIAQLGDDCYLFVYKPQTFGDSMKFCQEIGGDLSDVDENTETFLVNYTTQNQTRGDDYWIGLIYHDALEQWIWLNGKKFSHSKNFVIDYYGQCAVIQTSKQGFWNNRACKSEKPFICKRAMSPDKKGKECPDVCTLTNTTISPSSSNTTTNVSITSTTSVNLGSTQELLTKSVPKSPQSEKVSEQYYTLTFVLAGLLALSFLINVVFFVRCLSMILKRHRDDYKSAFHQEISVSSIKTPPLHPQSPPVRIPQNARDDLSLSMEPKTDFQERLARSSTFPRISKVVRKDSEKSEITMFINEVYNGDQVPEVDDKVGVQWAKKKTSYASDFSSKKCSLSDNDSTYDVPVSPTSLAYSFKRSNDDIRNGNVELDGKSGANPRKSDQEEDFYLNETVPAVIPEEDPDSVIQFGDGRLGFHELTEVTDESVYANTSF